MNKLVLTRLFLPAFILLQLHLFSQKECAQWYLPAEKHYYFDKNGFAALPAINIQVDAPFTSVSDNNGNMILLAANGVIYNRSYKQLPFFKNRGNGINAEFNNVYFVKKPGSASQYYFFYCNNVYNSYPAIYGVSYALIDVSLDNGFGDVVEKDVVIDKSTSPGFTIIASANEDFWVITHTRNTNKFNSWLVTAGGINTTAVKSAAGMDAVATDYSYSHLKASPNGKFIAGVTSHYYPEDFFSRRFTEVYNFNAATGKITTRVKTINDGYYGSVDDNVEFSPDSRLLYEKWDYDSRGLQPCGFTASNLWQRNLCYTDSGSFTNYATLLGTVNVSCATRFWGQLQLAPDKKIYLPYTGADYAASIQNSNVIGSSVQYQLSTPGFAAERSNYLPTFYQGYINKAVGNNIVYDGGCYPSAVKFSLTNSALQIVEWNFDDIASGADNKSALTNPSHAFSAPGTYKVSAILFSSSNVPIDTLYNTVEIKDPSKKLLAGLLTDTAVCNGVKFPVHLSVVNGIFYWHKRYKNYLEDLGCSDSLVIGDWGEGTYIVEMHQNDCDGCTLTDSIQYILKKTPEKNFNNGVNFYCPGDSVLLNENNPGAATVWSTGDTTQYLWAKEAGKYTVIQEYNNNGCIMKDTINVKENASVQFTFPADTTLCNNETLLLDPGIKNSYYTWQDNSYKSTYTVTKPGTYWVSVKSYSGCTASDTINVSYVSGDAVYLGNDTTVCESKSLLLQSNIQNADYLWSTGETTNSIYVQQSNNYWLKVSNSSCTVSDTINVQFNKKPVFSLGDDTTLCNGEKVLLNPEINGDYLWQDSSTAKNYTVSKEGLYILTITQSSCSASDSIQISYKSLPPVNLGNDTGFCSGQSITLNAYNNVIESYLWQDNSTLPTLVADKSGTYYIKVKGSNNCVNSDSINITAVNPPMFTLGNDTTLCNTQSLSYNFNEPGAGYLWNDGNTSGRYTINTAGVYWLIVSQAGCTNNDSIQVAYNPLPAISLGNDTTLCKNDNYILNAYYPGAEYRWQDNSSQPAYTVFTQGSYFVMVNLKGCVSNDTININYTSAPVFSFGSDTTLCPGETLTLQPSVSNAKNYLWQDGTTLDFYIIKDTGLYSLKVSNSCGTYSDAISVNAGTCLLDVPDAFTPNNDGVNDVFKLKYPQAATEYNMVIYNRWGMKVFETSDPAKGWDGNLNSLPQSIGSYVWILRVKGSDNKTNIKHGMVTLLR